MNTKLERVAYIAGLLTTATVKHIPINSMVIAAIPDRLDGARVAAMWNDSLAEIDRLRAINKELVEALQAITDSIDGILEDNQTATEAACLQRAESALAKATNAPD